MLHVLLLANLAALAPSASMTDAERCQTRIAGRLGELGTFAPARKLRLGRTTVIRGVVDSLEKAPPPPPGMMAPTHVLVTRYSFRCELRAGLVKRVSLHRQGN